MRKLILNECYFYKKVTYTLISRDRIGCVIHSNMEGGNTVQFYYPGNWRKFKRYVA